MVSVGPGEPATTCRTACLSLPEFELQVLLRSRTDWAGKPVILVPDARPTARVLGVNRKAQELGLSPGMRASVALSLVPQLRSGTLQEEQLRQSQEDLMERLHQFSPRVEPWREQSGIYWLDVVGLSRLFGSLRQWGQKLLQILKGDGWLGSVAIGHSRFGTLGVALSKPGLTELRDPELEKRQMLQVPLRRLGVEPKLLEKLTPLGVRRLGELLALPAQGVEERFGKEIARLHRAAGGELWQPLNPRPEPTRFRRCRVLDHPEKNSQALLHWSDSLLHPLLFDMQRQGKAVAVLNLELTDEMGIEHQARLALAYPTLEAHRILELVNLRLERMQVDGGVIEIALEAEPVPMEREQLQLFTSGRRSPAAVDRALARLRAELGERAVVRAVLEPGSLPQQAYRWEPLTHLPRDRRKQAQELQRRRVRRRFEEGERWPQPRGQLIGPYRLSGGWWRRPYSRDYYFEPLKKGGVHWLYYDYLKKRWFREGTLE